ncbi:MAG: PQQ-binding-like beta-propeller repeat protein [Planctomycetia bacterium]|nr:PQQ-binding-like beta-propeller repeat protein [Planctomycetia bacterium]
MRCFAPTACLLLALALLGESSTRAADWPQFMRGPQHTGDAADEALRLPLGLATCVQLDDAVTTSPAVVAGRVYVVDQMGTAYCIDPAANRIVWKMAPDGERACGSNSSSACVVQGRIVYGTTTGRLHILDAATGKVRKSIDVGWPITGSVTAANDSLYFQDLGAIVHCLDLDGNERWRYDHYKSYEDPKTNKRASGFPGSWHDPHYGGGEIAISGKRLAVNLGWDLFCLDDEGKTAKLAWCQRAPLGKDAGIPMGPVIAGDWVYGGYPSTDRWGNVIRMRLADGSFDEKSDFRDQNWAVHATPAVRDGTVFWPRHYQGVSAFDFNAGKALWAARTDNSLDQRQFTSCIASPALTKEHCVFGTIHGDLYVVALNSTGRWPDFQPPPFKFSTAFGKAIGSSPVVANGAVYFGCDDGYLYGLAPEGKLPMPKEMAKLHEVRSEVESATGQRYGAPVASMDQANTNFVNDPRLKPPLRLRWACRPFDLRVQNNADDDCIYFVSEAGTLASLEQATGRIRWRRRLNGPVDGWKQMLLDNGKLYINRNSNSTTRKPGEGGSEFLAVDARTGETLWSQPWGSIQGTCRSSPIIVGNVVAGFTAEGTPPKPVARAFDAATGKPLWQHELPSDLKTVAGGACLLDGIMYFSCGLTWGKGVGSTIAVEPASGKLLWTSTDYHVHGYGRPSGKDGLLYLGGQSGAPMYCISAKDGKLKWQADKVYYSHHPALGEDYFVVRGYGGHGIVRDLATGKPVIRDNREVLGGCPDHACAPVLLTSGRLSYAVSSSGLYARDLDTGKIVWQSLGFAPRACTTPTAANGRLFYSPNVNNMLYCFEPAGK